MNMKKPMLWLLCATLLLSCLMVGCTKTPDDPVDTDAATQSTALNTAEETTEAQTEADTEEPVPTDQDVLNEILANKTQLRFNEDGQFKIMILADTHIPAGGMPPHVLKSVRKLVERENPDFVIFTGDNVVDSDIKTEKQFNIALRNITKYLEEQGIYWMHVYGNHDGEMVFPLEEQQRVYESFDHCLSKAGDENITGIGNYVIPLYGSKDDTVKFAIWGLDSGDYPTEEEKAALFPSGVTSFKGFDSTAYDFIHYDQIEWYKETSKLLQACNGGEVVPGLMAFHIPLQETYTAWENRHNLEWTGVKRDPVCSGAYNTGLFEVIRNRGDIKAIINGHDHINDFMVNYCGIKMCYASTITTTTYYDEDMMGTRFFVLNEENPADIQTYMVYLSELEQ